MKMAFKNHEEVCHVWAQQNQREGRTSRIFFDGPSIYSYGRHFEMARFVTPEVVFFTTDRYSVSTAKHLRLARQAVTNKRTFTVPSMEDHAKNIEYFLKRIIEERERKDQERKAKALAEAKTHLEVWKAGGEPESRAYFYNLPTALRIKGGEIETSHGASVPVVEALALYDKIREGRPVHGMKLGHYTASGFNGEVLTVGCHKIPLSEMDRISCLLEEIKREVMT